MDKTPADKLLAELGAEPVDGSGFEQEEAESSDEVAVADPELAR